MEGSCYEEQSELLPLQRGFMQSLSGVVPRQRCLLPRVPICCLVVRMTGTSRHRRNIYSFARHTRKATSALGQTHSQIQGDAKTQLV